MESLFSSFLSIFSSPPRPLLPPSSPFRVRSVPSEEKPRIVTTTTKRSSNRERTKEPTPSTMNEKRIRRFVRANQSLPAMIFKAFDDIITNFIDPPLRDSVDSRHVLSDNFFPVDELPPTDCEVSEGTLPNCLDGVYLRNGPNPQFLPRGPYHIFDGDGMLHAIRISKGKTDIYCGIGGPMPKISGVAKLDVSLSEIDRQECIVASRIFGPGCFGGEPFFVAKEPDNPDADEDDGYIISYVHNEKTNESRFVVMDAKSSTLEIIAIVKLPRRVPFGFHGLFVKESDLNKL